MVKPQMRVPPWAEDVNATYRQLDYWIRRGWLHPLGTGSGNRRQWPETERRAARIMARCVNAGLTPEAAASVARSVLESEVDDPVLVDLADGLALLIA